ncbi:MAG: KamA family radical SAM protein [Promethearchaeota archaeon]
MYWKKLIQNSITKVCQLPDRFNFNHQEIESITSTYPMRINPYYFGLIRYENDPIWKQCIPDLKELDYSPDCSADPLHEEVDSPVPGLTHRYPDRLLLLISDQCAMYCRFCTRKRKVGTPSLKITWKNFEKALDYISNHSEVRDVILSGGDPLLLDDTRIERILQKVREIPHVEIIRIGSRVPCTLPQRITNELCEMLKNYHPLYLNTHFNHPWEITKEAFNACNLLANAGIPLGNQSVLLKGVNDDAETMKCLLQGLLRMRVRPYYIFQADLVTGTNHFRTRVEKGLEIMSKTQGFTSGLAFPHYVIDSPGGGGKIPVMHKTILLMENGSIILRNYEGKIIHYPQTDIEEEKPPIKLLEVQKQIS